MCTSRPSPPPPAPAPEPVAPPPITQNTQGAPKPAGYSESDGRNRSDATQASRRRSRCFSVENTNCWRSLNK